MRDTNPLTLTTNPHLSLALQDDGPAFEGALLEVGEDKAHAWLRARVGDEIAPAMLHDALAAWFAASTPDDRVMARADLAELTAGIDDAVSELLWDASLQDGFERADGDQVFDAVSHLARIAESSGDPLAAAEFYIEFLNWRRAGDHVSDPESVHEAFEELVRLAEVDGEPAAAARFAHAHSVFSRLSDEDDTAAATGDWTPKTPPFAGWD